MAITKQVDIDVNVKDAIKGMEELGSSFEDVFGEIKPLNTQIGEMEDALYQLAAAGETGSEEFELLSKQIGEYKKVIIDTDLAVDSMSQTTAQNLGGALTGVTAGFELGAGAMGAMGVEAEVVEEQLLKVQSAMAIAQGVQGIKEAIPSFKALTASIWKTAAGQKALTAAQAVGAAGMKVLNAVMNANPVLLLVTGITALVGAIVYFSQETENAADINDRLNKSLERQNKLIDATTEKLIKNGQQRIAMLEATGAAESEIHEERLKQLKREELQRKIQLEQIAQEVEKKSRILAFALEHDQDENAQAIKEELDAARDKYEQLEMLDGDYLIEKTKLENDYQQQVDDNRKADIDKYKQYLQDRKNADIEAEDLRLQLMADGEFKEIEILNAQAERKREQILNDEKLLQDEKQELLKLYDQKREQDEQVIRDRYLEAERIHQEEVRDVTQPDFEDSAMVEVEQEIFTQEQLKEVKDYYREQEREADRIATQEKIDNAQSYLDSSMQFLNSLQSLSDAVTDNQLAKAEGNEAEQEKIRKKAFERNKKLQLTMAVVQGVQGVMAAFTAGSSMGPAGVVMGPLMAALAAVTAGVNIAKIKNTQYGGGGSGGASVPQNASNRVPSFNVVGNSPQNQLAQSLGTQEQAPVKTFVVSGDVTTAQSLDRNKVDTASL